MAKYMGKVGLAVGIVIGIISRENYNYTMGQKMDDMSKDYQELKNRLDTQKESEKKTINEMKKNLK